MLKVTPVTCLTTISGISFVITLVTKYMKNTNKYILSTFGAITGIMLAITYNKRKPLLC